MCTYTYYGKHVTPSIGPLPFEFSSNQNKTRALIEGLQTAVTILNPLRTTSKHSELKNPRKALNKISLMNKMPELCADPHIPKHSRTHSHSLAVPQWAVNLLAM